MYLLAIDIGNTNVSVGIFDTDTLVGDFRLKTDASRPADEYAALLDSIVAIQCPDGPTLSQIDAVVVCSVVPAVTEILVTVCNSYLRISPFIVTSAVDAGMAIRYDPPSALGADRLVNAFSVFSQYSAGDDGQPVACIVADFGTATKLEAVSADGIYLGGAILPGVGISLEALFGRAALLRQIPLAPAPSRAIGQSTADALRSGILFGYAAQIDGLVSRFRTELGGGEVRVVATGGHAALVVQQATSIDLTDAHLTVQGLRLLYRRRVNGHAGPSA